jgi:hypothetical protein
MKLYTEEQVRTMLDLSKLNVYGTKIYSKDELIEQQKPIELPSDEEIGKDIGSGMHDFYKGGFIEGAKWIKEQILNQNKS